MKHIRKSMLPVFVLCLFMSFLLAGCGGEELILPAKADLKNITIQEYSGDRPVSMEVTMPVPYDPSSPNNFPGGTYFYNPGYSDWKQVTNSKKIPAKQTSLRYVFTEKNGTDTEVFLYKDGKYKYLELPGKGVWREEDGANGFLSEMKSYRSLQFNKCFGEPAAAGDLKLPDNYNGAGKAVWVDLSGEQDTEWWDRGIPEDRKAERPEDVRYVVVAELKSKEYIGYWYDTTTGEHTSDSYDVRFTVVGYDLMTGEEKTVEDDVNQFHGEKIKEYLAGMD